MTDAGDVVAALTPVVAALDALGVPYRVGGSVATSAYGVPRSTLDVDLVCDLPQAAVAPLVARLQADYYVDDQMIEEAIRLRRSFNIIHLATMLKVDVFLVKRRPFDEMAFSRHVADTLEAGEQARIFSLSTPEDMIVHKLDWYRAGDEVSERQWLDVLGVLKVQREALDWAYLRQWAAQLGLSELLERAERQSGLRD